MSDAASLDLERGIERDVARKRVPEVTESLAARLIRRVFGWYFLVTLIVTCAQMGLDYRNAEERLTRDIAALQRTFSPGINDAMWGLNYDVLRGILSGMRESPAVVGVKVVDESGGLIVAAGTIRDQAGVVQSYDSLGNALPVVENHGFFTKLLSRDVEVAHRASDGATRRIGAWTVYSDRQIIIDQVTDDFGVILVNSIVKTLALWIILFLVIGRTIGRPLRQLSAFVESLNIDNLGTEPFVLDDRGRTELHLLTAALNLMTGKLRRSIAENSRLVDDLTDINANLQTRVAERTRDLEELAATDLLTGLNNRRKLNEAMERSVTAAASAGNMLSLILCDIDHFKSINDSHGHQVGDLVLVSVSALLRAGVRATDLVGRWGGEEFMIVCPGASIASGRWLAERLRLAIADARLDVVGQRTCSFGVAQLRSGETAESLIGRTDAALYRAKQRGRNRVETDG